MFAICVSILRSGCEVLVHHFDTVVGFTPTYSANHLLVRFFSAKTIFSLLISSILLILLFLLQR